MRTRGEIEADICKKIAELEQHLTGRGPQDIHTHLVDDQVEVRFCRVLTAVEQHLVKTETGRGLLKQIRAQLVELARPVVVAMIQAATGIKICNLCYDLSASDAGEEAVLIKLAKAPLVREKKRQQTVSPPQLAWSQLAQLG